MPYISSSLTAVLLHQGISAVIHVASPFFRSVDDPRKDLLDPARQGTVKVLEACLKQGVRRVVVTGSIAAVIDPTKGGKLHNHCYRQFVMTLSSRCLA